MRRRDPPLRTKCYTRLAPPPRTPDTGAALPALPILDTIRSAWRAGCVLTLTSLNGRFCGDLSPNGGAAWRGPWLYQALHYA